MIYPENTVLENQPHTPPTPPSAEPVPGIDLLGQPSAKQPRNQHLKIEDPKTKSFTARATQKEYDKIHAALQANGKADIVRLMLFALDLFDNDILTPFKTK